MRVFKATYVNKNGQEITENFHCEGYQILDELNKRFPNVDLKDITVREITSLFYKTIKQPRI